MSMMIDPESYKNYSQISKRNSNQYVMIVDETISHFVFLLREIPVAISACIAVLVSSITNSVGGFFVSFLVCLYFGGKLKEKEIGSNIDILLKRVVRDVENLKNMYDKYD